LRKKSRLSLFTVMVLILSLMLSGCAHEAMAPKGATITVTDQLGRTVTVPKDVTKITGTHHFAAHIAFALGQQDKLVDQAIYGNLGKAIGSVDPVYAAKPYLSEGMGLNMEELIALQPQVAFVYASSDASMIDQFESAGIKVVAVNGETFEEAFEAVRLIAKVLNCPDRGEEYLAYCQNILELVNQRVGNVPEDEKPRIMFAGPKSVYTVASGDMLTTKLIELAGAVSVSKDIKGYWTEVSPEQVATWNPEVIVLGSSLDTYGDQQVYKNPHFQTVKAVQEKKVYSMPSNIGWWDFPAPNCVLGVLWLSKTFYPEKFADIDMLEKANEFYTKCYGHSFTEMGGKL
jgi:iron complex transport system substrate-binding protein